MSDITITSSTYAGELAEGFLAAALTTADSIANGYITVHENVKFKQVLQVFSQDGSLIQDFACDFTSAGQLTLAERVLTVTEKMVNLVFCKEQFRSTWQAYETGRGFIEDVMPPSIEEFIIMYVAGIISESNEYNMWQGNYDPSGASPAYTDYNGICQILEADAGTNDVDLTETDGTTAATTISSGAQVITNFNRILNALPTRLRNKERFRFFVSRKTQDFYLQRLAELGVDYRYQSNDGSAKFLYNGYEVVAPAGFPDDTIIYGNSDNFHFGTDLVSDQSNVKILDMSLLDGSDNVRNAWRFTAGTQVGVPGDVYMCFPDAV
jgi:hypothetical protein